MFSRKLTKSIVIGATAIVLGGGAYGVVSASAGSGSGTAPAASSSSVPFASHGGEAGPHAGGESNARSGPAAGGASGAVESVSTSGFTMSTSAGQEVTVDETSSTTYRNGTGSISAGALKKGESVLVLGTTDGTTITAAQVVVQSAGAEPASTAAEVVPFQQGAPSASKQVGQIPAGYSEGSGTIVSGTEANKATEAALAAYPGGIVDRVVKLSNGEYEVHNIGVNWPHHIFVDQGFKVVGAE
jgi:membrane-bound inhibitor of C-type lysozyme